MICKGFCSSSSLRPWNQQVHNFFLNLLINVLVFILSFVYINFGPTFKVCRFPHFSDHNHNRGCSSVVERSLCMWKARGSIPRISTPFARYSKLELNEAVVAEWLRRWTWNPMGSARVGSNPANCDNLLVSHISCSMLRNENWIETKKCLLWGLNPWPLVYETSALPLS